MKQKTRKKQRSKIDKRLRAPADTYTTPVLCERYDCAPRTLRRLVLKKGYPRPTRPGLVYIYSKTLVHAWEKIHMPHLHPQEAVNQDDEWFSDMRAVIQGERAAARLIERDNPRRPAK